MILGCACGLHVPVLDEVLERVGIEKRLNPLNQRDFLVIQRRIGQALQTVAAGDEAAVARRAMETLDVDWPNLSAAARERAYAAVGDVLKREASRAIPRVESVLGTEAPRVVQDTRSAAIGRFRLRIPTAASLTDRRIAEYVAESQVGFIRDEYGRRRARFSQRARDIVSRGIESGLGRDDITEDLEEAFSDTSTARARSYWQVIAGSFVGRARSYAQTSSFDEAGIEKYRFEAVLDEVTSEICRYLHGREFSVKKQVSRFETISKLRDPEEIRNASPWATVGYDDDGNQRIIYSAYGEEHTVATIEESAMGELDEVGTFSGGMDVDSLEDAGLAMPPLHGNCRSSVVAIV